MIETFHRDALDAELTEIHRQKGDKGQGVLSLATILRNGNGFDPDRVDLPGVKCRPRSAIAKDIAGGSAWFTEAGLIIADTNTLRRQINALWRKHVLGETTPGVVVGDILLIGRNNTETRLANGDVLEVLDCEWNPQANGWQINHYRSTDGQAEASRPFVIPQLRLAGTYGTVPIRLRKSFFDSKGAPPMIAADYGRSLTCHAAQGSERDGVVIAGDWMGGKDIETKTRFLYTAITRAKSWAVLYIPPLPPLPEWQADKAGISHAK